MTALKTIERSALCLLCVSASTNYTGYASYWFLGAAFIFFITLIYDLVQDILK